jgi:hypothetical protein
MICFRSYVYIIFGWTSIKPSGFTFDFLGRYQNLEVCFPWRSENFVTIERYLNLYSLLKTIILWVLVYKNK